VRRTRRSLPCARLTSASLAALIGSSVIGSAPARAQMFAGYDQFCGLPVLVVQTAQLAVASKDPQGRPIIYIDPTVMANWSHSRIFTLAHECGHHRLGHTTPNGESFRQNVFWATKSQELAADCWATKALRSIWNVEDIRRVIRGYNAEGNSGGGGYPTGRERAANIAACATEKYGEEVAIEGDADVKVPDVSSGTNTTPFGYKPPDWMK
jgi:hypothetical protein